MLLGGRLATADNAPLNSILNGDKNAVGSFWLGITTMFIDGQWLMSDGSNSTFTNWAPGQPVNNNGSYCSFQNLKDEKWYSEDCSLLKPYFCEIPQASRNYLSICPPLPSNESLSVNKLKIAKWFYVDFTGKCYLMLSSLEFPKFDLSRNLCQKYGADDLVVIKSFEENSVIGGIFLPYSQLSI
uniref:C-type lectin domain-containing protein n=1 Tax=Acrobeloides nanus TaxID=290746 RepID=A0A914D9V3_9BILA